MAFSIILWLVLCKRLDFIDPFTFQKLWSTLVFVRFWPIFIGYDYAKHATSRNIFRPISRFWRWIKIDFFEYIFHVTIFLVKPKWIKVSNPLSLNEVHFLDFKILKSDPSKTAVWFWWNDPSPLFMMTSNFIENKIKKSKTEITSKFNNFESK